MIILNKLGNNIITQGYGMNIFEIIEIILFLARNNLYNFNADDNNFNFLSKND